MAENSILSPIDILAPEITTRDQNIAYWEKIAATPADPNCTNFITKENRESGTLDPKAPCILGAQTHGQFTAISWATSLEQAIEHKSDYGKRVKTVIKTDCRNCEVGQAIIYGIDNHPIEVLEYRDRTKLKP